MPVALTFDAWTATHASLSACPLQTGFRALTQAHPFLLGNRGQNGQNRIAKEGDHRCLSRAANKLARHRSLQVAHGQLARCLRTTTLLLRMRKVMHVSEVITKNESLANIFQYLTFNLNEGLL